LKTSDFDYELPPERIAQTPIEPRHNSRLMVLHRSSTDLEHSFFYQIGDHLEPGDLLVINQTRVIPARIFARKESGGKVELLLLKKRDELTWEGLVGGKRITTGKRLSIPGGPDVEILQDLHGSHRWLRFNLPVEPSLERLGQMPLPPYIHEPLRDPERYQTVYARQPGSAAAPTAGLHFTPGLMESLRQQGVIFATVTLHVGLDTFAPVNEDDPHQHEIHTEWCDLSPETAKRVNQTRAAGKRVVAVGTTSVRTLESAARDASPGETVVPISGPTDLYILPGHRFKAIDGMVTNFHLPRSTLVMLVSAFVGRERLLDAYRQAVKRQYRFYSFGDAMLIL
jgi:S-adenosylmethionine:tRNA ribosyltransferase-isomerase